MISAKAAGPPQWQAAPPLTASMSINATSARVALGSPKITSSPLAFLTLTEYLGGPAGVGASLEGMRKGVSGGAATGLTTDLSSDISFNSVKMGGRGETGARGGS